MKKGTVRCPVCSQASDGDYIRSEAVERRMGQLMTAVVEEGRGKSGKEYPGGDRVRHGRLCQS